MEQSKKILFIGDSLIEFFDWQARFPLHQVTNLGWSGETVQELAVRSERVDSEGHDYDFIFVMIGTNNVAMDDYSFMPAYKLIIDNLRQVYLGAQIVLTGLFPLRISWISDDTIIRLNELIKKLAQQNKCDYLEGWDTATLTFDLRQGFSADGVHLSDYGYQLWSDTIEEFLSTNQSMTNNGQKYVS